MYKIFFFIAFIFICITSSAQSIKGKIVTSDNKPAEGVTVQVKGLKTATTTNENGEFTIAKLPAGNYELEVSLIGYETLLQSITVEEGKALIANFTLKISDKQLQAVIISSGRNKFVKKESEQIARLPLKNLENPQVYNVVGKEVNRKITCSQP